MGHGDETYVEYPEPTLPDEEDFILIKGFYSQDMYVRVRSNVSSEDFNAVRNQILNDYFGSLGNIQNGFIAKPSVDRENHTPDRKPLLRPR